MSVNGMNFEQAGTLLAAINAQATGKSELSTVTTLGDFISLAQNTLRVGYDPVLNAISQVLERTIFSVRPYNRRFSGLERTEDQWGAITRKISYADKALKTNNESWPYITSGSDTQLDDGEAVDPYIIWKPDVLETRFYGSAVWEGQYTIFRRQLDVAFSGPQEFGAFMSGLMTHFANEREFWIENMTRAALLNLIAGKLAMASESTPIGADGVVNLGNFADDTLTPDQYSDLVRRAYATIDKLSRRMESRSQLYQQPTGKDIFRHTPVQDQKIYILADLMADIEARTLSTTYNDNWLQLADHEEIDFWQAITDPSAVKATGAYYNFSSQQVATKSVDTDVVGVMFDRDACGYNLYQNTVEPTPYNPRGEYYNLFAKTRMRLYNDFSEKVIVLTSVAESSGGANA